MVFVATDFSLSLDGTAEEAVKLCGELRREASDGGRSRYRTNR